ncbi:unnamed protein product [Penicillium glandicola]
MFTSHQQHAPRSKISIRDYQNRNNWPLSRENLTILPCKRYDTIFNKWDGVRDEIVKKIDLTHVFTHGLEEVRVQFPEARLSRRVCDSRSDDEAEPKRDVEEAGPGEFHQDVVRLRSMPGQSLALDENVDSSGTFGGFFEIKLPGITQPKVVGLTCFHVIDLTEKHKGETSKAKIRQWRTEGIKPNDKLTQNLKVAHPSRRAIRDKTRSLEKEIDTIQTPQYKLSETLVSCGDKLRKGDKMMYLEVKQQLSDCKALLHDIHMFDPSFGKVWAASGYRTGKAPSVNKGKHSLPTCYDWALIEVPRERVGSNTKSGYSEGRYNALKEANVKHEIIDGEAVTITTIEHSVIPIDNNTFFAKHGDSGSLVYTKDTHVVVGLFFAGRVSPPVSASFTHISDLIADIKHITGATHMLGIA